MGILEVVQSLDKGGRTVRFCDTVEGLRSQGQTVTAVSLKAPTVNIKLDDVVVLPRKEGLNWRLFFQLARLIRKRRISLIHAHCELSQFYAGVVGRLLGVPVVGTFHRSDVSRYRPSALNWVLKRCLSRFIAVSSERMALIQSQLDLPPDQCAVVHGGTAVGPEPDGEQISAIRQQLSLNQDQFVILSLGHLGAIKGHQDSIQALALAIERGSCAHLYIAGEGSSEEQQRLLELTSVLGLNTRVSFLGQLNNAPQWLTACDIFLLPSREEAFGLVFIEAGAKAKPVIATHVGGIPDIVMDQQTGILVPPASPERIAEAIVKLENDAELCQRLGAAAYQRVATRFSRQHMVSNYLEQFQQLQHEATP
ncbi:Lipopolysaccharide core biosynthesis mannosyltransferase LpcC [Saliniradius amylolyticus]|uniref:Lipopolysaccharide core biosynthesis mannosyltransferase LpcC n=1 Tax=Saliniradius amylolyticus TaxID=2183582 RepID=A0A2S2E1X6_9ALTE|nr:glycosyltransferase family 4 protein [Saliniradius amylolyticus]AWL11651.1 Lipopolysaccharide core biosynthesis mannosyltransferase LpcC [Saliniradius amylolyticus]